MNNCCELTAKDRLNSKFCCRCGQKLVPAPTKSFLFLNEPKTVFGFIIQFFVMFIILGGIALAGLISIVNLALP